jgi:hypothetical protein
MPDRLDRNGFKLRLAVWLGWVLVLAGIAAGAASALDPNLRDWTGCWEPIPPDAGDNEEVVPRHLVCIEPGVEPGSITRLSTIDGQPVSRVTLVPDGRRRPLHNAGCRGWERSRWSGTHERLYFDSEMSCAESGEQRVTGAWMKGRDQEWLEVEVIRSGAQAELTQRRYTAADHPDRLETSSADGPGVPLRTRVGRLTTNDVIDDLDFVDPMVVEAVLLETRSSFPINSRLLLRLDRAGIPDHVIDLMVALSFPQYFSVNVATGNLAMRSIGPNPERWGSPYPSYWYGSYGWGYGWGHGPHGFYPRYPYRPSPPGVSRSGRGVVVSGYGYTRVRATHPPPGGVSGVFNALGSAGGGTPGVGSGPSGGSVTAQGSSGGSVTPQGHSSGGGTSKGFAKPR